MTPTLPPLPADRKYIVFGPNVWGADHDFTKALANCRKELGRVPRQYVVLEAHSKVAVDDMGGLCWIPEEVGATKPTDPKPYREVLRVGFAKK